ncbi:hypothetical protein VKT23_016261 [Stygiomarasmius scandens]|uniref:Uncharacterized protein n=1 Tax=Marasmiellus scandens TaxID=2682957 RepID=A0ABR1IXL6_9AGAR
MTSLGRNPSFARNQTSDYTRPPPSHRHAAPSAPWPWINLHDEIDAVQLASGAPPIPPLCNHDNCGGCWRGYPQSRFPNWTSSQVRRSGIYKAVHDYSREQTCDVYHVDVDNRGLFKDAGIISVTEENKDEYWEQLTRGERPNNLRVRALFIDNLSGPVLQMLGAKYNIEPFFFSSSLSWIPSRFQEEVREATGDHITITLTFLRTMIPEDPDNASRTSISTTELFGSEEDDSDHVIDTHAPLFLHSGKGDSCFLVIDLLSVHLIRNTEGNTLISYHHTDKEATSAPYLHERIRFAGQSVYWQSIFQKYSDPTFLLLCFIWHAMYAWDESLEKLYSYICYLESKVMTTSNMSLTRNLHIIRAHHLHYSSLLEDFHKSIKFILTTPNPAMDSDNITESERINSRKLLEKECNNLLVEIERLEQARSMQDKRLKNVMNLVFSTVNIGDSKRMQELTEAAVRDSAGTGMFSCRFRLVALKLNDFQMKQIAYLSMIFLPASFVAAFFGMNVKEIAPDTHGTLHIYFETAIPLTGLTIWVVIAFQSKYLFRDSPSFWMRLLWPLLLLRMIPGIEGLIKRNKLDTASDEKRQFLRGDGIRRRFGRWPRQNRDAGLENGYSLDPVLEAERAR